MVTGPIPPQDADYSAIISIVTSGSSSYHDTLYAPSLLDLPTKCMEYARNNGEPNAEIHIKVKDVWL